MWCVYLCPEKKKSLWKNTPWESCTIAAREGSILDLTHWSRKVWDKDTFENFPMCVWEAWNTWMVGFMALLGHERGRSGFAWSMCSSPTTGLLCLLDLFGWTHMLIALLWTRYIVLLRFSIAVWETLLPPTAGQESLLLRLPKQSYWPSSWVWGWQVRMEWAISRFLVMLWQRYPNLTLSNF